MCYEVKPNVEYPISKSTFCIFSDKCPRQKKYNWETGKQKRGQCYENFKVNRAKRKLPKNCFEERKGGGAAVEKGIKIKIEAYKM